MIAFVRRSARRMVCVGVLFAAAAGIAYAAIPDGGGVYTACMLNKVGTVRLIDPALPASNLMSHCTSVETQFTFNQRGQQGVPGVPGNDGVSPTVTQLAAGDSHCANGGAAIADAQGGTAYVCNGADGADGQPFSGTFTSANGDFSIAVDDTGITIAGPGDSIKLDGSGAIKAIAAASLDLKSGGATTLVGGSSLDLKSGGATTVVSAGSLGLTSGGATAIDVGGPLSLTASQSAAVTVGSSLVANVGGAASLVASSLDLKATGPAILEAVGPLSLRGSTITQN